MRLVLAAVEEVVDGIAVGEDNGFIAPLVAQDVDEQAVATTAGLALKALVGTHHLAHVSFLHQSLEGWQIRLPEVAVGRLDVHRMAQRLRTAVHGIVLSAGVGLIILVVVALHALDCRYAQHGVHIRVFAAGLLSASPTRVAEDVDIGTPERELRIAGIVDGTHVHMLHAVVGAIPVGTSLVADLREDIIDQFLAEGSSHADGLRVDGIVALAHTVARLAPPVVRRYAEAVNRDALVHHQTNLFLWRQHAQQTFYTLSPWQLRILPIVFVLSGNAHDTQCECHGRQE